MMASSAQLQGCLAKARAGNPSTRIVQHDGRSQSRQAWLASSTHCCSYILHGLLAAAVTK
jgi:hypothetical protein